ncbi:MAG TPA: hypothetical protein VHX42_04425, partial [Candidatus Babeliales bacterium]|nr:hypothetical protein [Candidatus Babeliales bacterium]
HHPLYWDGSLTTIQTFLDKKTTVQDIIHIIKQTIKQNKQFILQNKSKRYQIDGIIKNIKYTVGFERGRVGQFFIPINQSI